MKKPVAKPARKAGRRLSRTEWIEAEELYRQGWTQAQLADKYGVRTETISRHMTKKAVKGGEKAEAVRQELAAALTRKQREFTESKAQREIDAKEMIYKMVNVLVGAHAKEFQAAMTSGRGLGALQTSAKALKDSLQALKVAREEIYTLLDVKEGMGADELPDLTVSAMSLDEEAELRARIAPEEDDEEDDDLAEQMAEAVQNIDHQVELING